VRKLKYITFISLIISFLAGCTLNLSSNSNISSYYYDNEYHWQNEDNKEKHLFDEGEIFESSYEEEGFIIYNCQICDYQKQVKLDILEHNYSNEYTYDDTHHWHQCIDVGYENLVDKLEKHDDSNEKIIKPVSEIETGLAQYTCSICGHVYTKEILLKTEIINLPTITSNTIYVGDTLANVGFVGGEGSVPGVFSWTNPEQIINGNGNYSLSFIPTENNKYEIIEILIYLETIQLTINVECGNFGTSNQLGVNNVNYNSNFRIDFIPDYGYQVKEIIVDGKIVESSSSYTFFNIKENHSISVNFEEKPYTEISCFIEYVSGTPNAYEINDNTIKFNSITENSVYSISGEFNGNIVIDTGESFKFDLELKGFKLTSSDINPITILSGEEVSLTAKNGYENFIYDNREQIDSTDETLYSSAIYSLVDLEIIGKGSLSVESKNNKGIHTKDDLQVKNLNLYVKCLDNALKGNDSIEIINANTTLIATKGDCIKTSNSHINENTLNQKGSISINGGTHNLYAACDAIDAAYNVDIDNENTELSIFTDKYSEYSETVTVVSSQEYYLRYSKNTYKFSVKYFNSETDYQWVNAEYYSSQNGGRTTYYYYKFNKLSKYSKMIVYMYSSTQTQGQDSSYYACTSSLSLNDSNDTIALSSRQGSLSASWTSYSSSSSGGGMGGMNEGNSDKGDYSTKGIKASNAININNGTINIKSYDDGIHANNDVALENNETPLGSVTISGGNINIYSNDDGIHADGNLIINDGNISIANSYEGVEGAYISIAGGNLSIISKDDGMNATTTTGQSIIISGGEIYIYAQGDGIDSNSTTSYSGIVFSGGKTIVICNSNGNSALDSERGYQFSGGQVVAITPSGGMSGETINCSNFSSIGTKINMSLSTNQYVSIKVNSTSIVTIKMPCSISAMVVYLGSSSASISSNSTNTNNINSNGVAWN